MPQVMNEGFELIEKPYRHDAPAAARRSNAGGCGTAGEMRSERMSMLDRLDDVGRYASKPGRVR
jgi:hypothetical protein